MEIPKTPCLLGQPVAAEPRKLVITRIIKAAHASGYIGWNFFPGNIISEFTAIDKQGTIGNSPGNAVIAFAYIFSIRRGIRIAVALVSCLCISTSQQYAANDKRQE